MRDDDINLWEVLRRKRLALGPFYMGAGVAALDGTMHWVGTDLVQSGVGLGAGALAGYAWIRSRIGDPMRRMYAYSVLGASTSWVMCAYEGWMSPQWTWLSLGAGILVGGIPWWTSHVKRQQVRMEATLQDWPTVAHRINFDRARPVEVTMDVTGYSGKFTWAPGTYQVDDVLSKSNIARVESVLGADMGTLQMEQDGKSTSSVKFRVIERDPHAAAQNWPLPTHVGKATDPLVLGPRADGQLRTIQRYVKGDGVRHLLIGGATRSGKSGLINLIVASDACTDDVQQIGFDFKGGVELGPWRKCMELVVSTVAEAKEVLRSIAEPGGLLDQNAALMASTGDRVWDTSKHGPITQIVVDEAKTLLGSGDGLIVHWFAEIANKGGGLGVRFVLATQYPTLEAIGSSQIRQQIRHKFCFRMEDDEGESYVFGGTPGVRAHLIDPNRQGTCYAKDGAVVDRAPIRIFWISDATRDAVAEERCGQTAKMLPQMEESFSAVCPLWAERVRWVPVDQAEPEREPGGNATGNGNGNANGAEDQVAGDEGDVSENVTVWGENDPDVDLAEVIARRREAMTPEQREESDRVRAEAIAEAEGDSRSDEDAEKIVRRLLMEADDQGVKAVDLYRAAGRKSSWFYNLMAVWEADKKVKRTGEHGRWAWCGPRLAAVTGNTE
jgi:DNA segregation ATPase FtsK/SpoIIIE, S-DNA-T family